MKLKLKLLLLLALVGYGSAHAQFGTEQVITPNAFLVNSIYAADMDGDGDIDVLSASRADNKIAWYKNTDGQGNFTKTTITTTALDARAVYAADMDGDGDMDVLSASADDNKIAWYENTNGQGSFGTQQTITTFAFGARAVYAADMDGDGDMDVLSASFDDDKIAWYENTDGQGNFGTQQIITTAALEAVAIYAVDIDGDGDVDVLSASIDDNKIAWYENTDGQGNFGAQQTITTNLQTPSSVYAVDINGDGYMDVLSASIWDAKIAWYKNTGGQGTFSTQQVITTSAIGGSSVYAADIDNDGDMDVLSASGFDNKIAWYENTNGQGSFGSQQIITANADEAIAVHAADIDGDGDMDVIAASASTASNTVAWYENLLLISSVSENELVGFSAFPTPTTGVLTIESETAITQMEIYNNLGQLAWNKPLTATVSKLSIDISSLHPGQYFCKIKDANGDFGIKKIIKK